MPRVPRFPTEPCAACGKRLRPPEAGDEYDVIYRRGPAGEALCIVCWANGRRPPVATAQGLAQPAAE